jgi:hypothetical protein
LLPEFWTFGNLALPASLLRFVAAVNGGGGEEAKETKLNEEIAEIRNIPTKDRVRRDFLCVLESKLNKSKHTQELSRSIFDIYWDISDSTLSKSHDFFSLKLVNEIDWKSSE